MLRSNNKSHVGLGYTICPICGKKNEADCVLLDKRLMDTLDRENYMGHKLCPEHAAGAEAGFVFFAEAEKTADGNIALSGREIGIRRSALNGVIEASFIPEGPVAYMNKEAFDKLLSMCEGHEDSDGEDGNKVQ